MSVTELFTQLAYQFGPFFFAVLFTLVVTRTARTWYVSATKPLDNTEKNTFRHWFLMCCYFSIFLVIVSVAWYAYYHWGRHHALHGSFLGLRPNQSIVPDADQFFIREVKTTDPGGEIRDYYFVMVRNRPWQRGEKLYFKYWELPSTSGAGERPKHILVESQLVETDSFPVRFVLKFNEDGTPVIEQRK